MNHSRRAEKGGNRIRFGNGMNSDFTESVSGTDCVSAPGTES